MKDKLQEIIARAKNEIETGDKARLENLRVSILGKKGELTSILKQMGALPKEDRPKMGQLVNEARENLETLLEEATLKHKKKQMEKQLQEEVIDVSLAAKKIDMGSRHPLTVVMDNCKDIFIGMGYSIAEGPEIETDYYNFEALNMDENHPARDEQDTFYTFGGFTLRTQTSPMQIRVMENTKPPIRIIAPGRVFRSDQVDATHSPIFHQLEGLVIDKNITMCDLKGALDVFAKELLGENVTTRFRPHHFPFTEPSAEMDVSCFACSGKGCKVCKDEGFIELLGCGMVHPNVLKMAGLDPNEYSGFAFGLGLERLAMQKFGITDMRLLYENDYKFLNQF